MLASDGCGSDAYGAALQLRLQTIQQGGQPMCRIEGHHTAKGVRREE